MNFKSAVSNTKWVPTISDPAKGISQPDAEANLQLLTQLLVSVLLSENLAVLTGLGTSMCVKDATSGKVLSPTMADLWNKAKTISAKFDEILKKVKYPVGSADDIELLLSHCQLSERLESDADVKDFIEKTEQMIVKSCRFVDDLPATTPLSIHESFLRKVARRSPRKPRTRLFTTNYDLCFETAASAAGFVMVDGFSHTSPQDFDGVHFGYDIVRRDLESEAPNYISNVFQLYKLHGSVDWDGSKPGKTVKDRNATKPVMNYPRLGKFESSYDQPYLEMMSRFQNSMRQPNTGLLVIGFGFNDNHVLQPILSAVRSNVSLRLIVVRPDAETTKNATMVQLGKWIDEGDKRITLVAGTFEQLVAVIPELVTETEEDQHNKRYTAAGKP
jgi:SIR2-like domain